MRQGVNSVADPPQFFVEVAAFEREQGRIGLRRPVPLHPLLEVGSRRDGAGYREVKRSFDRFHAAPNRAHVGQFQCFSHRLHHLDFLGNRIHEHPFHLGKGNGQRNARKPSAGTDVGDAKPRGQREHMPQHQGMRDVTLPQVVEVLARHHIDLGVPFAVKLRQGSELVLRFRVQKRKKGKVHQPFQKGLLMGSRCGIRRRTASQRSQKGMRRASDQCPKREA